MLSNKGLSDRIRQVAQEKYIRPALRRRETTVQVRVRDLIDELKKDGYSVAQNTRQFCTSIQKPAFLKDNGLEIARVDGPPSKESTTVVVSYRVVSRDEGPRGGTEMRSEEDPLLALAGTWQDEPADIYVARLREGWEGR